MTNTLRGLPHENALEFWSAPLVPNGSGYDLTDVCLLKCHLSPSTSRYVPSSIHPRTTRVSGALTPQSQRYMLMIAYGAFHFPFTSLWTEQRLHWRVGFSSDNLYLRLYFHRFQGLPWLSI